VKNYLVKDLMVPLSEYATVMEGSTLFETIVALEKAQEEYDHSKYSHRAVLVLDKNKRVIGKLNQWNFIRALEPKNGDDDLIGDLYQFCFSPQAVAHRQELNRQSIPVHDVYAKATRLKVEDVMQSPSEGEYVEVNTSLDTAIHQLVAGSHLSLLVTKGKDIVGVLRLSDVFAALFHAMKKMEAIENKTDKDGS
jgi:CBS domain containing-hemolysin-like protein